MKEKQTCRTLFQKLLFYFLLIQLSAGFGKPFIVRLRIITMPTVDSFLVHIAQFMALLLPRF